MPEMDALSALLLAAILVMYFTVLFFLLSRAEEITAIADDVAQFLTVEGRLVILLIHALLLILWPLVMWVGIIKITLDGKWDEILKKKKPPRH